MSALVVTTTVDDEAVAHRLGAELVERRLAACVQVLGPIRSTYRWQGEVQTAAEWLLVAKTTDERYPALEAHLGGAHPYELPEIVATPVTAGSAGYLAWIVAGCTPVT